MGLWFATAVAVGGTGTSVGAVDLAFKTEPLGSDTRSELRAQTLLYGLSEDDVRDGQRVLAAARSDYARLIGALYDKGYYAPVISITLDGVEATDIAPTNPPQSVKQVIVLVEPGPRFRFGTARIAPTAAGTVLPERFKPGETAEASVIREAATAALEGWRDAGHAKAQIAGQQLTAQHSAATIDTNITVDPGPQLRFGQLIVPQDTAVRASRIRAITGLPEGKVYSPLALEEAQTRLQRTGVFRVARLIEAEEATPDLRLPIEAQLVDRKPRRFGFGAEISSRQGLGLSGFWLHRNAFGGAERLRFDASVDGIGGEDGGVDYRMSVQLDRPATFRPRIDLYVLAELESLNEVAFTLDRAAVEAGLSFRADKRRTFSAGLGLETARSTDAFGTREYSLLTLPMTAQYDGRDNVLNPTSGWFGRAELTPFAATGDVDSGLRATLDLRGYRSLDAGGRFVLAARAQAGSVLGPDPARSPTEMLFYSGGSATVRGHGYQSLGIELQSGETSGGASFVGLSTELRVKATDSLSVVGFVDYGVISDDPKPGGGAAQSHSGAGLGLRYDTGIGPLRLDLAAPLSGSGDGVQIYIGIGQAF